MKVNRPTASDPAPAEPAASHPPPAGLGPAHGVAVPRLEPTLPEGLRLGAFEIRGVIAHSRAAVVYRVSDHSLGIPAAIKEYMPLGVARRGNAHQVVPVEAWHEDTIDLGRRAFFAESRALARCDDPALLRVTQLWEINGTAYRVMPLYGGKRLMDLRREMRSPIDETALRAMLERLLDALGAYHASAGVHGNVTPLNILMPALDRPVLLGPGKASVLLATELGEPVRNDFEAAFAAPEQHEAADAAVIGPSADLFGLAQTLRYAITGAAPIGHESLRASIHRLLGAGVVSNYSDALLDALSSAAATVPAERPQSLDEFRQRLRRLEALGAAVTVPAQGLVAPASSAAPAPPHAEPPAVAQAGDPAGDDNIAETIDVSSVLGDLLQEPTDPRQPVDEEEPERAEPLPDPRFEPTLNFAFDTPVPPVHEPPGHAPHATHPSDVHIEQHRPHPPAPAAADRAPGHHASMHDDDDAEQIAASFRPKRSRLAAPVLRMTAFVITIAALAIVVILAVSGVWDPRGPELNLPPSATQGGGAALPSAAPAAPVAEAPPAADTSPPAVSTAETPAPAAAPAASAAPPMAPTTAPTTAATTATAPAAAPAPTTTPKPAPTPRESSASRRHSPTTEAAADPREACAGRSQFALYRCMQAQCARTRWAAHPECVRLRKSDRVDPS